MKKGAIFLPLIIIFFCGCTQNEKREFESVEDPLVFFSFPGKLSEQFTISLKNNTNRKIQLIGLFPSSMLMAIKLEPMIFLPEEEKECMISVFFNNELIRQQSNIETPSNTLKGKLIPRFSYGVNLKNSEIPFEIIRERIFSEKPIGPVKVIYTESSPTDSILSLSTYVKLDRLEVTQTSELFKISTLQMDTQYKINLFPIDSLGEDLAFTRLLIRGYRNDELVGKDHSIEAIIYKEDPISISPGLISFGVKSVSSICQERVQIKANKLKRLIFIGSEVASDDTFIEIINNEENNIVLEIIQDISEFGDNHRDVALNFQFEGEDTIRNIRIQWFGI